MMDMVAIAAIIGPPIAWTVVALLWWIARRAPRVLALRERLMTQVVLAVMASIAGCLGWIYFDVLEAGQDLVSVMLAALALLPSLPGVWLLLMLATGRFRETDA